MSILKDRVGLRLRQLGLSQSELARRADVSPSFVTDIMTERKNSMRLDSLLRIADALQVEPSFLTVESRLGRIPRTGSLVDMPPDDRSAAPSPIPPCGPYIPPPVGLLAPFINPKREKELAIYLNGESYLPVLAAAHDSGAIVIKQQPCARVARPPQLADVRGSYAVRVPNDDFAPRYLTGELVYGQPERSLLSARWLIAVMKSPAGGHLSIRRVCGFAATGIFLSSGERMAAYLVAYSRLIALHRIVLTGDDVAT